MGIYSKWILPPLLHLVMGQKELAAYRAKLIPTARGRVLEIGIGSGLNLPFYGADVAEVVGVDTSAELLGIANTTARTHRFPVELINRSAEALPFAEASFDSAVMTWTLCSISNPQAALREVRRVLKPSGVLCFVEHGLSPQPNVAAWQHRLTPLWSRISGGCHLDRDVDDLIEEAGWSIAELNTGYMRRGPRPMAFMYEGRARSPEYAFDAAKPSSSAESANAAHTRSHSEGAAK